MKKRYMYISIIIVVLVLSITAISLAIWNAKFEQTSVNEINTGCFDINFSGEDSLSLQGLYPIDDEAGKLTDSYNFTVTNTCTIKAEFKIALDYKTGDGFFNANQLKVYVDKNYELAPTLLSSLPTTKVITSGYNEAKVLFSDTLNGASEKDANDGETKTYSLRVWLDENVDNQDESSNYGANKRFEGVLTVDAIATK